MPKTRRRHPETLRLIDQIFTLRKQGGSFAKIAEQTGRSREHCRRLFLETMEDCRNRVENKAEQIREVMKQQALDIQGRGYNLVMFSAANALDRRALGLAMWRQATEKLMVLEGIDGPELNPDEFKPFVVVVDQEAVRKGANTFLPPPKDDEKSGHIVAEQ